MFEDFSFVSSSTTIPADMSSSSSASSSSSSYVDPLEPPGPSAARHPSAHGSRVYDGRFHDTSRSSVGESGSLAAGATTAPAASPSPSSSSRRLSIDTLTSQFDSHTPFESPTTETPRSAPTDTDEGFVDGSNNDLINYTTTFDYSLAPASSTSLDYWSARHCPSSHSPRTFTSRRHQRQLLSRLQALSDNGHLHSGMSLVLEECHPSSLPSADCDGVSCSNGHSSSIESHDGGAGKFSITSNGDYTVVFPRANAMGRRGAIVKRPPRLRKRKDRD